MEQERHPLPDEERREFHEEAESLWHITLPPLTWAAHFALSYAVAAVVCAKAPAMLGSARIGLALATLLALAVIAWLGWRAWQQWNRGNTGDDQNQSGKAEDRHQFLGHAAVLLALISAIGVVYDALPLLMLDSCQ